VLTAFRPCLITPANAFANTLSAAQLPRSHVHRGTGYCNPQKRRADLSGVCDRPNLVAIPVRDATSAKAAIEGFAAEPNVGLLVGPATTAIVSLDELSRLAAQYRLPAI
jgi:hypothetical protein